MGKEMTVRMKDNTSGVDAAQRGRKGEDPKVCIAPACVRKFGSGKDLHRAEKSGSQRWTSDERREKKVGGALARAR